MLILFEGENSLRDTLRFIEEKGGVGLWSWNLKSQKMQWSPGFFRLLGLEPNSAEPSYALLQTMVHPDDRRLPGEIEHLMSEGGIFEREFRIFRRDGRVRWILSRGEVLVDQTGRPSNAIGVVLDIPRVHEALSAVEALQERHSGLIKATSAIVLTLSADGTAVDIPHWQKFTGQSLAEVSGNGWLEAIHSEDRNGAKAAWDLAVANRAPCEFECRLRRVDGVYRWVRTRIVPVFKKDGLLREWVGVCVDIHDQKLWSPPDHASTVTGAQLRGARGILNWSVRDLADAAKTSASTIRRLEEIDGPPTEPEEALTSLGETLEKAGVEFLFPPLGKPGVRPR
jgi:PAS domain S-box-containing protein